MYPMTILFTVYSAIKNKKLKKLLSRIILPLNFLVSSALCLVLYRKSLHKTSKEENDLS